MSIKAMNHVWDNSQAKGGGLLVMLCLADHADFQGNCFPSVPYIARRCRMGESTVYEHLRQLEEAGELTRGVRPGRSTVYHVVTPPESGPLQNPTPPDFGATPPESGPTPPDSVETPPESGPITVVTTTEPKREPSASARDTALLDDFEVWYAIYPKKQARGEALRAYRGARKKKIAAATLLQGARVMAKAYPPGSDKKYCPMPGTWLNQERWADEEPEPNGTKQPGRWGPDDEWG